MKNIFSFLMIFLFLTACSQEQADNITKNMVDIIIKTKYKKQSKNIKMADPNKPLPKKPFIQNFLTNIEIKNKTEENRQYINSKIVIKDDKEIYYFNEEKDKNDKSIYSLTNNQNKAKYYRVVLGKTAENYCAVQDFYANNEKRTEPFIILDSDCTKSLSINRQMKDFLTFIVYEPQEKIYIIDDIDKRNNIKNMYIYKNDKKDILVYDNFNLNQRIVFDFHYDKENPDIYIRDFNENQLTNLAIIYDKPTKDGKHYVRATRYSNIDLERNTYIWEHWGLTSKGVRVNMDLHITDETEIKKFKNYYQSFTNAKKLVNR